MRHWVFPLCAVAEAITIFVINLVDNNEVGLSVFKNGAQRIPQLN